MSSFFSRIDRNLSMIRQPFMVFRLSLAPDEAVARCVTHWRTFKIRSETPGMREQFALTGWVGTELLIGNNAKAFLADAIATSSATVAVAELFPKAIPDRVRRVFVERTFVEIIARPLPGSAGRMCELWCRLDYTSTNETLFQEDFFASVLGKLEQSFQSDQVMLAPLEHLSSRELPTDVPLTFPALRSMRRAAKRNRR